MLGRVLLCSYLIAAGSCVAAAAPVRTTPQPAVETAVHLAQSRCANWQRECARLYGWQSPGWHACMGQPGAVRDCSRRSRGWEDDGGSDEDLCRNWRRECARLHGWQTRNWYSCMGQPGAIRDCAMRR
jgi:hypothetical protein